MKPAIRPWLSRLLIAFAVAPCAVTRAQQVPLRANSPAKSSPKSLATIPADIPGYGLILLRARVNNSQPLWFALDSGASFPFVINIRRARLLRLKLQGHVTVGGGAGPGAYEAARTRGVSIDLGGLKFADRTANVLALTSLEAQAGRPLDGLVGLDLFTRYVVEIDYAGNKIKLYDPQTYNYSGAGESVPLTLRDGHFFVPAKIEMPGRPALDGRFLVDTGGGLVTAVLTTPFAQSHNLQAPTQRTILDHSLAGLGGETRLLVSRATSFTLGKSLIREPIIYVSQDRGGALASSEYDGLIGGEILRKFKVIFDYPRRRLILEPNVHYNELVEYDMSGIRLRAEGRNFRTFRVYQVLDDSPAAEAGLRKRDVVAAINGAPASRFSLDEIYQMLKQQGREYSLDITRGARRFTIKIKMRRLV
jgi:hypothetical protein